jgi:hypothetical protein
VTSRDVPFDPQVFDEEFDAEEEDALLPEGKAIYSWEKFSSANENEGWGNDGLSPRRRRRRYEGD